MDRRQLVTARCLPDLFQVVDGKISCTVRSGYVNLLTSILYAVLHQIGSPSLTAIVEVHCGLF